MGNKTDVKELNEMLDSILKVLDGKETSLACASLARAIGILWGYLSANGAPEDGLDELFRIIRAESLGVKSKFKPGKIGFMLNQ